MFFQFDVLHPLIKFYLTHSLDVVQLYVLPFDIAYFTSEMTFQYDLSIVFLTFQYNLELIFMTFQQLKKMT